MTAGSIRQYQDEVDGGFVPVLRRDPLSRFDSAMRQFVDGKRALGASWSSVARMIERSEHDLRLAFDEAYDPPEMLMRPKPKPADMVAEAAEEAEDIGRRRRVVIPMRTGRAPGVRRGGAEAQILTLVAKGADQARMVATRSGRSLAGVRSVLATLRTKGLIEPFLAAQWRLTDAGRTALAAIGEAD